jgi:hypothetical protein
LQKPPTPSLKNGNDKSQYRNTSANQQNYS